MQGGASKMRSILEIVLISILLLSLPLLTSLTVCADWPGVSFSLSLPNTLLNAMWPFSIKFSHVCNAVLWGLEADMQSTCYLTW